MRNRQKGKRENDIKTIEHMCTKREAEFSPTSRGTVRVGVDPNILPKSLSNIWVLPFGDEHEIVTKDLQHKLFSGFLKSKFQRDTVKHVRKIFVPIPSGRVRLALFGPSSLGLLWFLFQTHASKEKKSGLSRCHCGGDGRRGGGVRDRRGPILLLRSR